MPDILQQNQIDATFDLLSIVPHSHPATQIDCAKIHNQTTIPAERAASMVRDALKILYPQARVTIEVAK